MYRKVRAQAAEWKKIPFNEIYALGTPEDDFLSSEDGLVYALFPREPAVVKYNQKDLDAGKYGWIMLFNHPDDAKNFFDQIEDVAAQAYYDGSEVDISTNFSGIYSIQLLELLSDSYIYARAKVLEDHPELGEGHTYGGIVLITEDAACDAYPEEFYQYALDYINNHAKDYDVDREDVNQAKRDLWEIIKG